MKTEYIFTTQQKAKLADIDRQIDMLLREKADIYMNANVRYVTETLAEFEAAKRLHGLIYGESIIPKQAIAKMIFRKEDAELVRNHERSELEENGECEEM